MAVRVTAQNPAPPDSARAEHSPPMNHSWGTDVYPAHPVSIELGNLQRELNAARPARPSAVPLQSPSFEQPIASTLPPNFAARVPAAAVIGQTGPAETSVEVPLFHSSYEGRFGEISAGASIDINPAEPWGSSGQATVGWTGPKKTLEVTASAQQGLADREPTFGAAITIKR